MNRRFFVAWLVVFVVWMVGAVLVHGHLLGADYASLPIFRPESDAQRFFPLMILAHAILAGAFTWIYAKGVEARDWLPQGLRFGLAVAFLTIVPTYLIYYVVQPIPQALVIRQIVYDGLLMLILGVVVAFLYRNAGRPAI